MGWIDVLLGIRKIPSEDEIAEATERLADLLEVDFPGVRAFCRFTIYPSLMGWICRIDSRVQGLYAWYEVSIWGSQIDVARIARKLRIQVEGLVPQAKAHELACNILGDKVVQQILTGGFYQVESSLNNSVTYQVVRNIINLYKNGVFLGTFCLQAKDRYPIWDVILSRIFMLQGSELDFLRTAVFYPDGRSGFSRQVMTREQIHDVYGRRGL